MTYMNSRIPMTMWNMSRRSSGKVTVTNTGTMVLVRGPIDTTIEMECSRCLDPVRAAIHADLEEEFDIEVVESAAHRDPKVLVVEEEIGRVFDGQTLLFGRSDPSGRTAGRAASAAVPRSLPRHSDSGAGGPGSRSHRKLAVSATLGKLLTEDQ